LDSGSDTLTEKAELNGVEPKPRCLVIEAFTIGGVSA